MVSFSDSMRGLRLEDNKQQYEVSMFTVGLALTNMRVSEFHVNIDSSTLAFTESAIVVNVTDVSLLFDLDFKLASDPDFLTDKGVGAIALNHFNVSLEMTPVNDNGALQLDFIDAHIMLEDYTVHFDGQTDISKALELMMEEFKDFFKNEVVNIMARKMLSSVERTVNEHIRMDSTLAIADGAPAQVNLQLMSDPILSHHSMTIPLQGGLTNQLDRPL